jgi:hypothetical protein
MILRSKLAALRIASCTRFLLASVFLCLWPAVLFAGTVSGTVRNGTTKQPAAGVDVVLIGLQGGMQTVANTKTDSAGRYHFDNPNLGQAPMLIRAIYRGVNYHEPAPPGKTTVDIEVFEPTNKPDAFSVTAHAIVLEPSGTELTVGEIYSIENKTEPPMAFFREDGSFLFSLPDGAQLGDVSASGSTGMPVTQGTIDKGKDLEAIAYPFRPGESGVRISYKLPYAGNEAKLKFVSPYAADRFAIFAPPGVQVSGAGLSPAPPDQGFNVYMRDSVAANTPVTVSVSGTAPAPSSSQSGAGGAEDGQNPAVNSRADQGGTDASVSATTLPARLDSLKWVIVAGFAAIFALGLAFLWRRPQFMAAGSAPAASRDSKGPAKQPAASTPTARNASSVALDEANRHVSGSLDGLKDKLFRLELRRQAGTISDADYARERQRIEQLLRDLVRG